MSGCNNYEYYNNSRSTNQSQYQNPATTSASDRQQYATAPAYGTYNRSNYVGSTASQSYQSYASTSNQAYNYAPSAAQQSASYQQPQSSNHAASTQPYYSQQQTRPASTTTSTTASETQYQISQSHNASGGSQAQRVNQNQRYDSPSLQQPQQTSGNRYSNVRAESSQQGSASYQRSESHNVTTVDPTKVYDDAHERRRQLKQAEAEAARRAAEARKVEDEKRRVEAERLEAEERERDLAEARRLAEEVEKKKKATPTKKKAADKSNAQPASKGKPKGKAVERSDESQMNAAAMTLLQTANASNNKGGLESAMKAMFAKMREFNQADPEMLSRLWQQERDEHLAKETAAAASPIPVPTTNESATNPKQDKQVKKVKPTKQAQSGAGMSISRDTPSIATPTATAAAAATSPSLTTPVTTSITATAPAKNRKGTVWPADKKAHIAESASRLLKTMAGNRGKTLSPAVISEILDGNPKYVELCDAIEAHGVKVDRSELAKQLITAVPDVNKQKIKYTQSETGAKTSTAAPEQTSEEILATAEKRLMKGASVLGQRPGRPKESSSTPTGPQKTATMPPPPAQASQIDPQLDNAMDAVKIFGDGQWIDPKSSAPTKGSKDRKASKSQPAPAPIETGPLIKQDMARKRNFNDLIDLSQQMSDDDDPYDIWNPPSKRANIEERSQLPTPPEEHASKTALSGLAAVQQLNNWRPQASAPFASMSTTTTQQVAAPLPKPAPMPNNPLPRGHPARGRKLAEELDKHKAVRRSSYDVRTIARDVLLACGRHPDMRYLNAHLDVLRPLGITNDYGNPDLSTFRWDLVDPGGPAPGSGVPPLPQPSAPIDIDADDEDSNNDSVLGVPASAAQSISIGGAQAPPGLDAARIGEPKKKGRPRLSEPGPRGIRFVGKGDSPKRRGRPPRHSEGVPTSSRPPHAPSIPSGQSAYTALRDANAAADGEPKKRGRPVGWRKSMMADPSSYRGAAANKAPKTGSKKKSPSPVFQVFRCEWKNCKAELHNLATLRAHLHKLHGKPLPIVQQPYECRWKDCGKVKNVTDPNTGRVKSSITPYEFFELEAWKGHMENKHINSVAWKLGDGPKGGVSDNYESEVSESYMSDAQGRMITPRAIPPDEKESASSSKITEAQREAEQTRAEAEQRKRDIGPMVDRGGATLVTDKVRQAFRDDDDVAMVVDDDDDE